MTELHPDRVPGAEHAELWCCYCNKPAGEHDRFAWVQVSESKENWQLWAAHIACALNAILPEYRAELAADWADLPGLES